MLNSFRNVIKLSRPRFWSYLGGTYLLGYTSAISSVSAFYNPNFFLTLIYFLLVANILLYGVNDYYDQDTDLLNPKKKDKETTLEESQKKPLKNILLICLLLSLFLIFIQKEIITKMFFTLFLFLSYFYSAPPLRFKARPFLDFISNALYILPGIIGYLQIKPTLPGIYIPFAALCWAFAMHLFSAVPDIVPDSQSGIQTTAVFLGRNKSLFLCFLLWSIFSFVFLYTKILYPYNFLTLIYPSIPLFLLVNRKKPDILKIYWLFPYLNSLLGFITFILIIKDKLK